MIIKSLSIRCAEYIIKYGNFNEDELEIYAFGFQSVFLQCIHVFTMIFMGVLMGSIVESIGFIIAYSLIRTVAGGHHFDNGKICFLMSIILVIVAIIPIHLFKFEALRLASIGMLLFSFGIIYCLSPCDNDKKIMNNAEKDYFRKKAKRVVGIETFLASVFLILDNTLGYVIAIALFLESIGLLLGIFEKNVKSTDNM